MIGQANYAGLTQFSAVWLKSEHRSAGVLSGTMSIGARDFGQNVLECVSLVH